MDKGFETQNSQLESPENKPLAHISEFLEATNKGFEAKPTEFVHKNDEGYGHILGELNDGAVESEKTRVGIVVGNGAILSSLPEIPADVVIMSDYNPFIHQWTQYTEKALTESGSIEEYMKKVYDQQNPLYSESYKEGLEREMADLGERHFLSSEDRFQKCKEALERKKLVMGALDLRSVEALRSLAEALTQDNSEITFANLTNVWEHAGNSMEQAIRNLPFHPEARILFSSRAYTERFFPKMMAVCQGLAKYIENAKSAYSFWTYKNKSGYR